MRYDPIKDRLEGLADRHPLLRRLFYGLLNMLFLRAWYVRRLVRQLLPRDRPVRVLDAGTGFGQYAYFVARTFPLAEVMAVDVKVDYLARARQFIRQTPQAAQVTFQVDDLTDLMAAGPFDLILSVDVMEHIADDEAVFRHFKRVLRQGGHAIINTPSDKGGSDVQAPGDESFIEEHVRDGYAPAELRAKLERAGLEVVDLRYTYGPYGATAWQWLIRRPIQWVGRSWASVLLLPLYYAVTLPVGLLLHVLDVRTSNETGTGLLAVARNPSEALP
ncbi:MAG: methyltransferase domain-containing protein [Bacteroidetes bacterium]|jgi:2-polyprenyl-3-methyl-5-hydroxy-6-metoxy-1,4-benzoquinol methylase|nr:methyltransferase domain-containing protein [Bacteroidota bacterium]